MNTQSNSLNFHQNTVQRKVYDSRKLEARKNNVERIKSIVCNYYNQDITIFNSKRRFKQIVEAKHIAIYLSYRNVGIGYGELAKIFKFSNHTTVLHAEKKIKTHIKYHRDLAFHINELQKIIEQKENLSNVKMLVGVE